MSLRRILGHRFVRNVTTVAAGTAMAQALTLAFSPIITRLYGPEAFGLQSVFTNVVAMATSAAALGLPFAIMLPGSHAEARDIAALSIMVGVVMAALAAICVGLGGEQILSVLNADALIGFLYLIPLAVLLNIVFTVVSQWLIRMQAYSVSARSSVLTSLLVNVAKTGGGLLAPSAGMLIAANTTAPLISSALAYLGWRRRASPGSDPPLSLLRAPRAPMTLIRRYKDFPLFLGPQTVLSTTSHGLTVLMLASTFGAGTAGQFALAMAVLAAPSNLIGGSVTSVFLPRINHAIRAGEDAGRLILKATGAMAIVSALPLFVLILTGPTLFSFVFGAQWERAGVYASWLSPWLFLQFVSRPSVAALAPLRLNRGLLIFELFTSGTKMLAIWAGLFLFGDDVAAIAMFSLAGAIAYGWLITWVVQHSRAVLNATMESQ